VKPRLAVHGAQYGMWAGRIVSTLAVLFLLFDAVIHLMKAALDRTLRAIGQPSHPTLVAIRHYELAGK